MTQVLILAIVCVVALSAALVAQIYSQRLERAEWRAERRFLVDRVISRHVGEVVALEREDTRKEGPPNTGEPATRPLIEGLS